MMLTLPLFGETRAYGYSSEDVQMVIETMAAQGKEPTFCMGDDIPLAAFSQKPHMLYDYFKQRFAQVSLNAFIGFIMELWNGVSSVGSVHWWHLSKSQHHSEKLVLLLLFLMTRMFLDNASSIYIYIFIDVCHCSDFLHFLLSSYLFACLSIYLSIYLSPWVHEHMIYLFGDMQRDWEDFVLIYVFLLLVLLALSHNFGLP